MYFLIIYIFIFFDIYFFLFIYFFLYLYLHINFFNYIHKRRVFFYMGETVNHFPFVIFWEGWVKPTVPSSFGCSPHPL